MSKKSKSNNSAQLKDNGVGQPSKYEERYCEHIIEFFKSYPKYEIDEETGKKSPLTPPTFYAYAAHLNVCRDTLLDWRDAHPKFRSAYKAAKDIQAQHIVENNMEGVAPTAFSIFMMKNNHGWTDRIEQKIDQTVTLESLVDSSFEGEKGENQ